MVRSIVATARPPDDEKASRNPALTVFYDGTCPICSREIAVYRRCGGADRIDFVDASSAPVDSLPHGVTRAAALSRFHVARSDGTVVSGGRAFAEVWRQLPAWRHLGRLFSSPLGEPVIEGAYRLALPIRNAISRMVRAGG